MSARLRLWACVCACTLGDESDRLRFRRRPTAADAGVARVDPLDENDRKLRGVYGVDSVVAGVNGEA